MNTYGYVGGNPLRRFDLFGLTQCDIDSAFLILFKYFSGDEFDVPLPKDVNVKDLGFTSDSREVKGETGTFSGDITMDDSWLALQDKAGLTMLLLTAIHESLHRNDSVLGRMGDALDEDHTDIKNKAKSILTPELFDAYEMQRYMCGCEGK